MAYVKSEDNTKYEDLLNQAGKCDSIAYEKRIVTLIIECSELSKKELEDKLNSLEADYQVENEKFKKDKEDYETFKKEQKEAAKLLKSSPKIIVPKS